MPDKLNPYLLLCSVFGLSSLSGLAALLRGGNKLTPLTVSSAMLNSGLLGLGVFLICYDRFKDNIFSLLGICVLCGLGGATMVDFIVTAFKRGGFSIGGLHVGLESKEGTKNEPTS